MAVSILDNPAVRERLMLLSVAQYQNLCRTGAIPERTELFEGFII